MCPHNFTGHAVPWIADFGKPTRKANDYRRGESVRGSPPNRSTVVELLSRRVGRIGVFRPIINREPEHDSVIDLLIAHPGVMQSYDDAVGVTYAQWHADQDGALSRIVDRFGELSAEYDAVVVVGSDYTDVTTGNGSGNGAAVTATGPLTLTAATTDPSLPATGADTEATPGSRSSTLSVHPGEPSPARIRPASRSESFKSSPGYSRRDVARWRMVSGWHE